MRRRSTTAIVSLALATSLCACTSSWEAGNGGSAAALHGTRAPRVPPAVDGWTIAASIEVSGTSPVAVAVGAPRAAPRSDARPWVQHDLVFENRGSRRVRFADTRRSAFLGRRGDPRLLAADEGCGYAPETRESPIEAGACLSYLDTFALAPGASGRRSVTLFKELRGMERLAPGRYVFVKPIRFRVGTGEGDGGDLRHGVIRLVYDVARASP